MGASKEITVGIVGTSWWVDAMYLPALAGHPNARVLALCGRDETKARELAAGWGVPEIYTDYGQLIGSGRIQAVIVATRNDAHYAIGMRALEANLHVLCEKPLALSYPQAAEMAALAEAKQVTHMVPFTYRYMPVARYLKELIEEGYIGQPYHLNMRYYTGFGRTDDYLWRFDPAKAGSGAIGDIGSHFLYLAGWYFGEVVAVSCLLGRFGRRPPTDPAGRPYAPADDTAIISLEFASGAHGAIHASTMAYEDTPFGQTHHMEFHGSDGTLYAFCDWDAEQSVSGAREGEGAVRELPIPDRIWGGARRDRVHNTYRDVFRTQDHMAREFITAIAENRRVKPDFHDGAWVQQLIDAAVQSDRERRRISLSTLGTG